MWTSISIFFVKLCTDGVILNSRYVTSYTGRSHPFIMNISNSMCISDWIERICFILWSFVAMCHLEHVYFVALLIERGSIFCLISTIVACSLCSSTKSHYISEKNIHTRHVNDVYLYKCIYKCVILCCKMFSLITEYSSVKLSFRKC